MHGTVKKFSDLLHLHCGTASQIIQHKAAFRKKQQVKKNNEIIILNT
jgi:hypothetical protein